MKIHLSLLKILSFAGIFLLSQCQPKLFTTYQADIYDISESVKVDPQAEEFIIPYKQKLDEEMNAVIGESAKELNKLGRGETLLGNFVADIQKEFAEETFGFAVDISIINNGGLRNILPKGDITIRNIFELSPFDNYLFILSLTADEVKTLAEYAVNKKNLGINGMYIESEDNKLIKYTVQGQPVEKGKTYLLAINDYLANGGDQMAFLIDVPRKEKSSILLRDMIIKKIMDKTAAGIKLDAEIEGRQKLN